MILKRNNIEIECNNKDGIERLMAEGFKPLYAAPEDIRPAKKTELEGMTVKELREYAKTRGLELSKSLRKQEILEILEDA